MSIVGNESKIYSNKIVFKNASWSLVIKVLSLAVSMLTAPLMLQCLGTVKYGVWATLLGFVSWIYYFDLGIISGVRFKLATYLSLGDRLSSQKVLTVAYVLLSLIVLSFFAGICLFLNTVDLQTYFQLNNLNEDIRVILIATFALACLNFVLSIDGAILNASQQTAKVIFFEFLGQIFFAVLIWAYIKFGISWLLWLAIGQGLTQVLRHLIASGYVFWQNKFLVPNFRHMDFSYSQGIMSYGIMIFIMQIAALVLNTTDNMIILKYYGGDAVTPYSFCYKYFGIINMFFMTALSPAWSAYTAAYARHDIEWIVGMMKKSGMLYGLVLIGTLVAGYIFEPFSKIWLQKELYYAPGLIMWTGLYFALLMCSHIFSSFVNSIAKLKEATIAVFFQAMLNVPLSIFLAENCGMGVNGVIFGSVICIVISLIVYPYVTIRELRIMRKAWR